MRLRWVVPVLLAVAAAAAGCDSDDPTGAASPSPSPRGQQPAVTTPTPSPAPAPTPTATEAGVEPPVDPAEVGADELGEVPVLMYHRLLDDGGGAFDRTPEGFRSELEWLFDHDYVPVTMTDVVDGRIDIPAGTKPVVLTFDDSPLEHAQLDADGQPEPGTVLAILEDVAAGYEQVEPVALWSVLPAPFGGNEERGTEIMRALHDRGHDLSNHSCDHRPLRRRSREDVQRDLACGRGVITDAVPDAEVRVLTLPQGVWPDEPEWAYAGETDEGRYEHEAVLLVGSNPAPSPFSVEFDPLAMPRIRSGSSTEQGDFESAYWLDHLESSGTVYVSDGDADRISFPADRADELADEFAERANPYEP